MTLQDNLLTINSRGLSKFMLERASGQLNIERVQTIKSLAELLGHDGPVVECRIPTQNEPEWLDFKERGGGTDDGAKGYASRDGTEAMSPTARDVIVPGPVDAGFRDYLRDMFGADPRLHILDDPSRFTAEIAREIMGRYDGAGQAVFYGWWAIDDLPPEQQLLSPEKQRLGNSKEFLSQVYPADALPSQRLLRDPRVSTNGEPTIRDIDEGQFYDLRNGGEAIWAKASKELMSGRGVEPVKTIDELMRFYDRLVDMGLHDASILLEEHLPGEGGSFTLIRREDGKVLFNHVTKQLSRDGKRIGNVIHGIDAASPAMVDVINLTADRLSDPSIAPLDMPGVVAFDTIEDANGMPRPNDPANRPTGTWTSATHRIHLIQALNLPDKDTVTMTGKFYLDPNTSFGDMVGALGKLTDWQDNEIVTIRSYFNGFGMACFYPAYTTTDLARLPFIERQVQDALDKAGIENSQKILA